MKTEFTEWEMRLPRMRPEETTTGNAHRIYPRPDTVDGLPRGWVPRWTTDHPPVPDRAAYGEGRVYVTSIIHREQGGWGAVVFYRVYEKTPETVTLLWAHGFPTVETLYRSTHEVEGDPVMGVIVDDLHQFVCASYDLADPEEEAEATLAALGGHALVFPAALTEPT